MWQVTQDLCNWPLELTVVTAMGKMVSEVFPRSPGYLGQMEGVLLKAWWECLPVWTDLGYCEGWGRSGIQLGAAPSATLCSMLWCLQRRCWLILLPGNPPFFWYLLWPVAFPLVFFFPCISCSGVESDAGRLQVFVIGRQWKACLGCLCCGLVTADEIKQQSDPVTTLSHILLTCFAWPALFLALCSSPGLFYIDRLTIFSPSLSLACLVCEDSQPECLLKVEDRQRFSVFGTQEILKDFWENNAVWGGVRISIRLPFLSAETLALSFRLQ